MNRRWAILLVLALTAALVLIAVVNRKKLAGPSKTALTPAPPPPAFKNPPVDISRPDAVLVTRNLAELPRDVRKAPLLKDVLTEDFLYYYESNEELLSLKGTLRRIAFEHRLTLTEEALTLILGGPARLALWRAHDGSLGQFMLVAERGGLAALAGAAAKIAAGDPQLSVHGERDVGGGGRAVVYKISHASSREIFAAVHEGRLIAFSNPDMALPAPETVKDWTGGDLAEGQRHLIEVSAAYLSFGHQAFFPSFEGIRFVQGPSGWDTFAQLKAGAAAQDPSAAWASVPRSPALCLALPVDAGVVASMLKESLPAAAADVDAAAGLVKGPVAACWYAESALYTPLFVARTSGPPDPAGLGRVFAGAVGALEAGILTPEEAALLEEQRAKRKAGEPVENPVKASRFEPALPIKEETSGNVRFWTREVSSRYGLHPDTESKDKKKMRFGRFFRVQLAAGPGFVAFSPDARLVQNAAAVAAKKAPALADALDKAQAASSLLFYPGKAAELLKQSALDSLPAEQESAFRDSLSKRLFPVMDRLKSHPGYALAVPPAGWGASGWQRLEWRSLQRR